LGREDSGAATGGLLLRHLLDCVVRVAYQGLAVLPDQRLQLVGTHPTSGMAVGAVVDVPAAAASSGAPYHAAAAGATEHHARQQVLATAVSLRLVEVPLEARARPLPGAHVHNGGALGRDGLASLAASPVLAQAPIDGVPRDAAHGARSPLDAPVGRGNLLSL